MGPEWKLVKLAHHCLEVRQHCPSTKCCHLTISVKLVAKRHNELSKEDSPTCTRLYPLLEMLMSDWDDLVENTEYEPVHDALRASIKLLEKYYRRADDTDAYFISHSK
jgi:hypothetical protein